MKFIFVNSAYDRDFVPIHVRYRISNIQSEIDLSRQEITKLMAENTELVARVVELEGQITKESDELKARIAKLEHDMEENKETRSSCYYSTIYNLFRITSNFPIIRFTYLLRSTLMMRII